MLESMITNPRPTRAECADVANAVLDGTDCVMLSGETANGEYPGEAVRMMANTCVEAESIIDYDGLDFHIRAQTLKKYGYLTAPESICSSAVKSAWDLQATLICVLTETGNSARMIAKYRPNVPIMVLTPSPSVARQCTGYMKNCVSVVLPSTHGAEALLLKAISDAKEKGIVKVGDSVVTVSGSKETTGATNIVRVFLVA